MNGGTDQLVAYSEKSAWVLLDEQLFTTNNGGLRWDTQVDLGNLTNVTRASDAVGYGLGVNGTIHRTDDGGAHWVPLKPRFLGSPWSLGGIPNQNVSGIIRFGDATHGWLFLSHAKEPSIVCFRTDDGGRTWIEANIGTIEPGEAASVYDVQIHGDSGWMVANTLPDKDGIMQRYHVLKLDDGRWIRCGQADTLNGIAVFAGVPAEFVFVREGKTKLVRYECKKD